MGLRATLARTLVRALGGDTFAAVLGMVSSTGSSARLGAAGLLKAYSTMPWLRAVVQKSAWAFATLPWEVFVAQRAGKAVIDYEIRDAPDLRTRKALIAAKLKTGDLRKVETTPLLDFLSASNPWFAGLVTREVTQQHLDLVGEACWILERNGAKTPIFAVPIPPTWVHEPATPARPTFRIVGPMGQKELPASEVVWFYHPDPADPFRRGTGTAGVLADELETDELTAKYLKAFFQADGRPPLIVTGEGMDKDACLRLEQKWLEKRAARGPYAPMFLPGSKVKVQDLGQTFREMQLGDLRKLERDIIIEVFGYPPEKLGIIESSNRATIDAADLIFAKDIVVPRGEFVRAILQARLVPEFDDRYVLDYVSPVAADQARELDAMRAAPWIPNVDEWRKVQGLPPADDGSGKVHLVPFNITPMDSLGGSSAPPAAAPPAKRFPAVRRELTPADIDAIINAIHPDPLAKQARASLEAALTAFAQQAIDEAGVDLVFNISDPRVQAFIGDWAGDRIRDLVDATTKTDLRATLNEGLANGETMRDLAGRVSDTFEAARGSRAMTIARTEIARGSNFGALEGMKQAGVELKEWLATRDNVVRDTHLELDGQQRPVDEPFVIASDGDTGMYPGDFSDPANSINCRCGVLSVLSKSEAMRVARWKALEADRRPFEIKMRDAFKRGFSAQEQAALAALAAVAEGERAWQAA
jgi:SPP1 gp7 family putative phage head morphogenesis protein